EIQPEAQRVRLGRAAAPVLAHAPSAEAERRHLLAGWQGHDPLHAPAPVAIFDMIGEGRRTANLATRPTLLDTPPQHVKTTAPKSIDPDRSHQAGEPACRPKSATCPARRCPNRPPIGPCFWISTGR